jgi:glyoxylase-like metal-dependent hydrolase (beta-lactamase superfamily II)
LWLKLFEEKFDGLPVSRVIVTHLHPDHVGLAGWLTEHFGAELWMSREEFLMCRAMAADTGRPAPEVALRFYRAAGYDEIQLDGYKAKFGNFGRAIAPLPDSFRRLVDLETITIGERYWQVIVGSGHSPEHAALYCPALKLLISGDQVLPRITPNVSVFPTEPKGDPLHEWLTSSARIREMLPDDVLVLPAHEAPFYGLHVRLSQLIEAHNRDLRIIVVGSEAIAAMERRAPPGDFRANLHRGGKAREYRLDDEMEAMAIHAAQIHGLGFAGVDLIMTSRGPVVIEVNSSPGLQGIETATRVDVAGAVIRHMEREQDKEGLGHDQADHSASTTPPEQ